MVSAEIRREAARLRSALYADTLTPERLQALAARLDQLADRLAEREPVGPRLVHSAPPRQPTEPPVRPWPAPGGNAA